MHNSKKYIDGRKWSDLPTVPLCKVAEFLNSDDRMDIRRLRAVCSSWRSSVPAPEKFPPIKVLVPEHIINAYGHAFISQLWDELNLGRISPKPDIPYILKERSLLLISPLIAVNDNSDESAPWIIQVEETAPNKWLLHEPLQETLSKKPFPNCPDELPASINLLDYKVVELSRSYEFYPGEVGDDKCFSGKVRKAIVQRDSDEIGDENFTLFVLFNDGYFAFWKPGAESWIQLQMCDFGWRPTICDIINHEGEVYALYKDGELKKFDNRTNQMIEFVPETSFESSEKYYLVEFGEDLYLLTFYVTDEFFIMFRHTVFVLNVTTARWDVAKDLGGAAFFVSYETAISVPAKDIGLPEGSNVIYFDNYSCYNSETDSEETCSLKCNLHSDYPKINNWWPNRSPFWPPPKWIKQS